ncbi:MAG: energy-coupling factor transporter transmembrane component T family protein [Catonella sp.]|uniref:energy-coupling factor transporter transmembrane component T family protein n=1 Tax=Catonella sp. TaxID=2382125 RepID=UPI003F9ECE8B
MNFGNRLFLKPITIGVLMIIYTSILFFSEMLVYWVMTLFSFILLFFVNRKKTFSFITVYILVFALIRIMNFLTLSGWIGSVYTMALIVVKLFPLWILVGIIMEFNTSEIIASLRKLKLPNNLCVGVSIFIRFIPEYRNYLKEIKEGLKVRNISFNIFKPLQSFEMYLVPLIYKAFDTANILTCSLITKGIEFDCEKTSYVDLSLTWRDYAVIIAGMGFIGITVWEKL